MTVVAGALPSLRLRGEGESRRSRSASAPKPKEGRRFRQPPGVAVRSLAHPGDGRAAVAASMVHYRQGTWNPAFQRSRGVRWPVTGTGAVPKSRVPASMSLRSLPALRRSGIAVRSSIDTIPKVVSFDHLASVLLPEGFQFRRGCGCLVLALPEGAAAPLQPAPPGPKTGFASMASGSVRCPKAPAPARPPVTPGTKPWSAIGRLSVPFPPGRCEHRPCGFPGRRPRPVPCGFPKAPAWFRP